MDGTSSHDALWLSSGVLLTQDGCWPKEFPYPCVRQGAVGGIGENKSWESAQGSSEHVLESISFQLSRVWDEKERGRR